MSDDKCVIQMLLYKFFVLFMLHLMWSSPFGDLWYCIYNVYKILVHVVQHSMTIPDVGHNHDCSQTSWQRSFLILTQRVRSQRAAQDRAGVFQGGGQGSQSQAPGCGVQLLLLEQDKEKLTARTTQQRNVWGELGINISALEMMLAWSASAC